MSFPLATPSAAHHRGVPVHVSFSNVLELLCAMALIAFLSWQSVLLFDERPEMWQAAALITVNGVLSVSGLLVCLRRGYPVLLACFYFAYLFFAIAPLQQIRVRFDPVFGDDPSFYKTILLCLMFTCTALVALTVRRLPIRRRPARPGVLSRTPYSANDYYPLVLCVAIAASLTLLIGLFGSALITTREAAANNVIQSLDAKPLYLLVTGFLNSFVFVGAVIGLLGARATSSRPWLIVFGVLLLGAEFVNNPFVTTRFRAAALIVFAMLALTRWNNARALTAFLFGGLLATPIIELFRTERAGPLDYRPIERFFAHIDYDAFAMTNYIVRYVDHSDFLYGKNILAVLLFFVPRAVWPDKAPFVASYVFPEVRYYRDVHTDLLSSPPFAEGYVDLGLAGAASLTIIVLALFVWLERSAERAQSDAPWRLFVCITPMLAIILLRGSFIVGYSEICSNFVAIMAAVLLLRGRLRIAPPQADEREMP